MSSFNSVRTSAMSSFNSVRTSAMSSFKSVRSSTMSVFDSVRSSTMSSLVATPWNTAMRIVSATASAWEVPMPAFSRLRTAARVSNVATLI